MAAGNSTSKSSKTGNSCRRAMNRPIGIASQSPAAKKSIVRQELASDFVDDGSDVFEAFIQSPIGDFSQCVDSELLPGNDNDHIVAAND